MPMFLFPPAACLISHVVLYHVTSCHKVLPSPYPVLSLTSMLLHASANDSTWRKSWRWGQSLSRRILPLFSLLPDKPSEEIKPFFFAPLFALSLPAVFHMLSTACISPCVVGCVGFWASRNNKAGCWREAGGSGGYKGNVSPEHPSIVLPGAWEASP